MSQTIAERLLRAAATGDRETAAAALAADVHFRGLTPRRTPSADDRDGVLQIMGNWFEHFAGFEAIEDGTVLDRRSIRYRVRVEDPEEGTLVFEQQAYYDADEDTGEITWMHVVCSGMRPLVPAAAPA